jgi:hypothetical protein
VLARLRACVGPASGHSGEALVEAVQHALSRQYERGYHDGWASFKEPGLQQQRPGGLQRVGRRMRRRARRGLRAFFTGPGRLRSFIIQLVLIVAVSSAAAAVSMRISVESHNQKWAPPVIPK